eukprot:6576671-Karenia_brevis.AAC.1
MITDSSILADMICGRAAINAECQMTCFRICDCLAHIIASSHWRSQGEVVCWRARDCNKEADFLANQAMNLRADLDWNNPDVHQISVDSINLCGWSDSGSRPKDSISSYAWILKGWHVEEQEWIVLSFGARFRNRAAQSSLEVECLAMDELIARAQHFISGTFPISNGNLTNTRMRS